MWALLTGVGHRFVAEDVMRDIVEPAVNCTKVVLVAAAGAKVKRVVYTSTALSVPSSQAAHSLAVFITNIKSWYSERLQLCAALQRSPSRPRPLRKTGTGMTSPRQRLTHTRSLRFATRRLAFLQCIFGAVPAVLWKWDTQCSLQWRHMKMPAAVLTRVFLCPRVTSSSSVRCKLMLGWLNLAYEWWLVRNWSLTPARWHRPAQVQAEKVAWELAEQLDLDLVAILPSGVFGVTYTPAETSSINMMKVKPSMGMQPGWPSRICLCMKSLATCRCNSTPAAVAWPASACGYRSEAGWLDKHQQDGHALLAAGHGLDANKSTWGAGADWEHRRAGCSSTGRHHRCAAMLSWHVPLLRTAYVLHGPLSYAMTADVAHAHMLAAIKPQAKGRYLLDSGFAIPPQVWPFLS